MKVAIELRQVYEEISEEVRAIREHFLQAAKEARLKDIRNLSAMLKDLRTVQVRVLCAILKIGESEEDDLVKLLEKLPEKETKKLLKIIAASKGWWQRPGESKRT